MWEVFLGGEDKYFLKKFHHLSNGENQTWLSSVQENCVMCFLPQGIGLLTHSLISLLALVLHTLMLIENLPCPCARMYAADDLIEFPNMWETAIPAGCWFQLVEEQSPELDQRM